MYSERSNQSSFVAVLYRKLGKWALIQYNDRNDVLKLNQIDFQISLRDIYHRVEFKKE